MRFFRTITAANRDEVLRVAAAAPIGAQIEIIDAPRTLAQNRLMWRLLTRIAVQVEHAGEHWDPEDWKCAFLKRMGKRLRFMPAIDGDGVVAIGYHSSKLSVTEMSEMVESIYQYGAEHAVDFDADPVAAAAT